MANKIIIFFATVFGVGFVPKAPGTFASLAGLLAWAYFMPESFTAQALALGICAAASVLISARAEIIFEKSDDKRIVIDEIFGMWCALFLLPKTLGFYIAAFVLFRFFDVKKPFIINSLQSLQGGLGVTLDDAAAGIISNVIIRLALLAGAAWL